MPHPPSIPKQVAKYQILRPIGGGSMSTVYLGHDPFVNRDVAIKTVHGDSTDDLERTQRKLFFNEAHAAGLLKHPNIVAILDAGVADDIYYLVMEYVPGERTLDDFTSTSTLLPLETSIKIMFQCAMAMHYAHGKGLIHRDLKPRNVLVTKDLDAKISDFGIAIVPHRPDAEILEQHGSPLYMAPEQLESGHPEAHSDVFALGTIMYELVTGRHPFSGRSLQEVQDNICTLEPVPPSTLRKQVPKIFDRVVSRALAKSPRDRYQTSLDLAGDLSVVFDFVDVEALSRAQKFAAAKELSQFRELADTELWELIAVSSWKRASAGQTLILEGDVDRAFYIIIDGEVSVSIGGRELSRLGKGDCFGEMGYVSGQPRHATIQAVSEATCMKISAAMLDRTSQACQLQFHKLFLYTLIERLQRANQEILTTRAASEHES
jgi:serine/threonine protein kinase